MSKPKYFKTLTGERIPLPVFFPDATRAVLKTLDSVDIEQTKTKGILVNTYHLYKDLGKSVIKEHKGIRGFMNFHGAVISDSGGFQVMSLAKTLGGKITDSGVTFKPAGEPKVTLTPEDSIEFQLALKTDMVVVLDDFTLPTATHKEAEETVERTLYWAKRCRAHFDKLTKNMKQKPYLLGVVQGGFYQDLRKYCTQELVKIGFDGLGYGGWPITETGEFDYETPKTIAENAPDNYFLYGLGVGKPHEIVNLYKMGFNIFDCVLPTRDARHKRLYVYNSEKLSNIDVILPDFYSYFVPDKEKYYHDTRAVSTACDCLLCTNYSRAYLAHLFRNNEMTAGRLATIHNLRFYSILMEKLVDLREDSDPSF
ncbi:MAG TPA: tRNA guanosine(34) transglycosylase Tgt [Patescibacteria group bacterium]|nr:tRNA guanosine(34) transglycosylase Tgt [Patescibacteria group bacterium]